MAVGEDSMDSEQENTKKIRTSSPVKNTLEALIDINEPPSSPTGSDLIFLRSDNFSELINLIKNLDKKVSELSKKVNENHEETKLKITQISDKIEVTRVKNTQTNPGSSNIPRNSDKPIPEISLETKEKIIPNWGKIFHKRRTTYRKHCWSKLKAEIYDGFVNRDSVYIPPKFRPHYARDEEDYKEEEEISILRVKKEVRLMKKDAENHKKNYEHIDQKMYNHIEQTAKDPMKTKLLELWSKEVSDAEPMGEKLAEQNLAFVLEQPEKEPYLGYSEIQENKPYLKVNIAKDDAGLRDKSQESAPVINKGRNWQVELSESPKENEMPSTSGQPNPRNPNVSKKKNIPDNTKPSERPRLRARSRTNVETNNVRRAPKRSEKTDIDLDSDSEMDTNEWTTVSQGKRKRINKQKNQDFQD